MVSSLYTFGLVLPNLMRVEAAVVLGQLLLDDVGLDGHAEMIGLAGEVGGDVVVLVVGLERALRR